MKTALGSDGAYIGLGVWGGLRQLDVGLEFVTLRANSLSFGFLGLRGWRLRVKSARFAFRVKGLG